MTIQGISHVGIQADDPDALAAFYRDVLDMQIVGGSAPDSEFGASVYLSNQPNAENHHLAIFRQGVYAHTAFKVGSLADLRACYRRVTARGLPVKRAFNHGVSFAFYFDDPEGHTIGVYWPTGRVCPQPHRDPLDLSLPEAALLFDAARFPERSEG